MTIRNTLALTSLILATLLGLPAYAEDTSVAAEASAAASATVSASEAIAAVEKQGEGKVVELSLDGDGTALSYRITLLSAGGTESNYVVDAKTGAVVQVSEAWQDQGDGDGETADDEPAGGDGDGETADDGGRQGDGDGETAD